MSLDLTDLLSLREAAALLEVDYDTIWRLIQDKSVAGYRVSGQWYVSWSELLSSTAGLRPSPPEPLPAPSPRQRPTRHANRGEV